MWLDDRPTALYRLYDEGGMLLYVGITANLDGRMTAHRSDKPWWPDVARTDVEWHDTRTIALDRELQAIRAESPRYNVAGTPGASQRRELEDHEFTVAEARGLLVAVERGILDLERPLFVVDERKARNCVAVLVSDDFYRRGLAALGLTPVTVPYKPVG